MFSPCICGSSHLQADEDDMDVLSPSSTPKRSKKGSNPYANRGLDKFSALLADLEGMKQKIYTQMGSDEISFVRFAFSNSNNAVKPIVVKSRNKKQSAADKDEVEKNVVQSSREVQETGGEEKRLYKTVSWKMNCVMKWENWKKPGYYLPVAIILILGLLAIYGRTFAVMCTSIGWYVIPTIRESSSSSLSSRKQKRKRDYSRKFSCKTVATTN